MVGISRDSLESHKAFAEKLSLPYPILVDEQLQLHRAFGVLKEKDGKAEAGTVRSTFILDERGKVLKSFRDVKPEDHAEAVAELLKQIDAEQ